MFGRKRKEREAQEKKEAREFTQRQIAEVIAFGDVGDHFEYLGRDCVITGHCHRWLSYFDGLVLTPRLSFDYCDNNGVLRHATMDYSEVMALKKNLEAA